MGRPAVRFRSQLRVKENPKYQRLLEEIRKLKGGIYVKIGYLGAGGPSSASTETTEEGITMPQLGATHEFGKPPFLPARPHIGPAFDRNRIKYEQMTLSAVLRWMDNPDAVDLKVEFGRIGAVMVSDVRELITDGPGVPPPNAPSVFKRKLEQSYKNLQKQGRAALRARGEKAKGKIHGPVEAPRTLVDTGRMLASLAFLVIIGRKNKPQEE